VCYCSIVDPRKRAWLLLLLVALVSGGAVYTAVWLRSKPIGVAAQLKRMPERDAAVFYLDFAALRAAGVLRLLDASQVAEDADYRRFAQKINLDWRQDLDSAMIALAPSGKYMLVRGRFDWKSLRSFARSSHGECNAGGCRLPGSTRERHISFVPLQSSLMALAVSSDDDWAVHRIEKAGSGPDPVVPDAPFWMRIPGSVLRSNGDLPSGTRMFAHSVEQADTVTLMLVPASERLEARLDVACRTEKDAADMAADLTRVTTMLREMIEREHQKPNPSDLSGVLTSGTFHSDGKRVLGSWPIEHSFLETLLSTP
jgi:hypothetical protein